MQAGTRQKYRRFFAKNLENQEPQKLHNRAIPATLGAAGPHVHFWLVYCANSHTGFKPQKPRFSQNRKFRLLLTIIDTCADMCPLIKKSARAAPGGQPPGRRLVAGAFG